MQRVFGFKYPNSDEVNGKFDVARMNGATSFCFTKEGLLLIGQASGCKSVDLKKEIVSTVVTRDLTKKQQYLNRPLFMTLDPDTDIVYATQHWLVWKIERK